MFRGLVRNPAWALEAFLLCLTVQKTPSQIEALFFHYVILKSASKWAELYGWKKVPILTQNCSSLNTMRRQREIKDLIFTISNQI